MLFEKGIKRKGISHKQLAVLSLLLVVSATCFGQKKISLDDAVKMALQNNAQIKNQLLKTEYIKALIGTAGNIPKTSAMVEYGQINSAYNDTKFTIGQSMAFPTVYKRQHQLRTEEWKSNVLTIGLREYEVRKSVTQVFYAYIFLKEKQTLLQKTDSLFSSFLQKAKLRLEKGESNILEKTTRS